TRALATNRSATALLRALVFGNTSTIIVILSKPSEPSDVGSSPAPRSPLPSPLSPLPSNHRWRTDIRTHRKPAPPISCNQRFRRFRSPASRRIIREIVRSHILPSVNNRPQERPRRQGLIRAHKQGRISNHHVE